MKFFSALVTLCLSVSALGADQEVLGNISAVLDDYVGYEAYPVVNKDSDPHYAPVEKELIQPGQFVRGSEDEDGEINPKYGPCTDYMRQWKRVYTLEMGKSYRVGAFKYCNNRWDSHLLHWKTFAFSSPHGGFITYDKAMYQDNWCNAKDFVSATVVERDGDRYVLRDTRKGWTWAFVNSKGGRITHRSGNYCTAFDHVTCWDGVYLTKGPTVGYADGFSVPTFFATIRISNGYFVMDGRCNDDNNFMDTHPSTDYALAFFEWG